MSKKDYQAIARAIYETREETREGVSLKLQPRTFSAWEALEMLSKRLADVLAADSPRFDRARFIEACETGSCKGTRKAS